MILYIGFYGWLLYIAFCVWYNWYLIEVRKKRPNYPKAKAWRFFWGTVALICMTEKGFDGFDPANLITWIQALPAIVFILSSWGVFFDPSLNIARGKKLFYRGEDSGILDQSPLWLYYSLKILCVIALPISIIILLR